MTIAQWLKVTHPDRAKVRTKGVRSASPLNLWLGRCGSVLTRIAFAVQNTKVMNPFHQINRFLMISAIAGFSSMAHGQAVVNGKNLNEHEGLEYIQLMYYVDRSTLRPVFYVDYGFIEPEYTDIIEPV